MSDGLVVAALLSALLHAGWNAAVKASARPTDAMTAQMLASSLLVLPGLWWLGCVLGLEIVWSRPRRADDSKR